MYVWRVNNLADEFRAGTVTDRQQLPYLLVFIGLTYLISDPYINGVLAYNSLNNLDLLMLPLSLIVGLGGTIWCYNVAEREESETGFISRYICLGIPIFVRIVVAIIVVMIAIFIVNDFIISIPGVDSYVESEETEVFDVVMVLVIEIIYFWWLRLVLRRSYANA
jgi:hypothetical protein